MPISAKTGVTNLRTHPFRQIPCKFFFKHHVSDCGQQCNCISGYLSLDDLSIAAALSCKQRNKSVNKWWDFIVFIALQYILTIYFQQITQIALYSVFQWPGNREFGPPVETFGHLRAKMFIYLLELQWFIWIWPRVPGCVTSCEIAYFRVVVVTF